MFDSLGRAWTHPIRNRKQLLRRRATVTLSLLALLVTLLPAAGSASPPTRSGQAASGAARVQFSDETGKVSFLGSSPGAPILRPAGVGASGSPAFIARSFMDRLGGRFGIRDQARELSVKSVDRLTGGRSVVRLQQHHHEIPVIGGELVVNLDASGNLLSANGEAAPSLRVDTEPQVARNAAARAGLAKVAREHSVSMQSLTATTPELWIYDSRILGGPGLNVPRLVWRTEVTALGSRPINELVLVDAELGSVALSVNQIAHAKNRIVCDANSTSGHLPCVSPVRSEGGPAHAVQDVNDAYEFAGDTYDFFAGLGRDSLDDNGMTLVSTVRYCPSAASCPYRNAFWNGAQMVYGTGFAADDVVGHELAHGVTDFSSQLFYYYQSGAINESLSDVFGEFMDLTNGAGTDTPAVRWLMGEDIPGIGAIRDMANPGVFGDPDRMTSPNYTADPNEVDAGGVHSNSGVNNKAAFLMTDGGTFNGRTVTGLGIPKTSRIYYEASVNMLTSASDYADLAAALLQTCNHLVGTGGITAANCVEVGDAIAAVEMTTLPPAAPNPEAPVCPGGQTATNLYFDDLENTGSGNWAKQTGSGTNTWFYPQNPNTVGLDATFATSGDTNLWGFDRAGVGDYSIAMTSSTALPAGGTPYLHFDHAFGFEDDASHAYDGGVLEYSTNNGASWIDAGSLPKLNGYTGTITNGRGNPLSGRSAFVRESNGYISSRYALSSLAGQSVRFRFRIGTDSFAGSSDYGWFIDDVSIHTCGGGNQPPTDVEVGGFAQPWMMKKNFSIIASAQDPDGIDFYDVTSRVASVKGGFQAPQTNQSQNGNFNVTMPAGLTVCFTATATDNLGATSADSDEECTAIPANNTSLAHKKKWSKKTAKGHFLNSFSTTKKKGAALHLDVRAKRLALVATKCPGCGAVKVLLGNQLLKKVKLNADSTRKKKIIGIKTFGFVKTGTVKIVVTSKGKPVKIEGLGASKR